MPELPEVQTIVDHLNQAHIVGRAITDSRVYWPKTIAGMDSCRFCLRIKGSKIRQITRRGKYIVLDLSCRLTMLIHLRMSGRLNLSDPTIERNPHEHVILQLDNTTDLRFQDTRKFGRIVLTDTPQTILGQLGPEPLSKRFTGKQLFTMLQACRRQIKPLLLDQHFLAGLGNIYVDEALWTAGIHPLSISSTLSARQSASLHRAIRHVLRKGIKNLGTSLGRGKGNFYSTNNRPGRNADQLNVFRRTGMACPRCKTAIMRIIVAQRSSHICPHCQKPLN
ncbi:MutM: formamidopyrimidine-DNA glycosylase [Desulfosarcina variabilis str. Montpellier]|uniref:bifunctional DNA-formamidopyrimidine glycosylase/DNA-(apurinic or apyrimidinic site) lyase n=1 Tax=Desulfosarcina variabilis TaxID=2300 RepID=UPI003AFB0573